MQRNTHQAGSALAFIIILVVLLIGALGVVFWNNLSKKEAPVSLTESKPKETAFCSSGENTTADDGTFCSEEIGIKFTIPSIFAKKLAKTSNYEVFEGSLDPNTKKNAGSSENVYSAAISGYDNFTLTIAQEPLRTGYVGVADRLQNTYFDQATGELTLVTTPTSHYDSATNTYTTSGAYSKGETTASFSVDSTRFFKGTSGDAGQTEITYFGVINSKIVKISLKNEGYIGDPAKDPSTVDAGKVFDELDKSINSLKIAKP